MEPQNSIRPEDILGRGSGPFRSHRTELRECLVFRFDGKDGIIAQVVHGVGIAMASAHICHMSSEKSISQGFQEITKKLM